MYHYISKPQKNTKVKGLYVTPKQFEWQIKYLLKNNFNIINFEDIFKHNYNDNENNIVLTFDDGSRDLYENMFPIIQKYKIKTVIYTVVNYLNKNNYICNESYNTDALDYISKEQLIEMSNNGVEFGSHLMNHTRLTNLTLEDQEKEIKNSINNIEELTQKNVYSIAYPYGDYNSDTIEICETSKLHFGVTTQTGVSNLDTPYKLNRFAIKGCKLTHYLKFRKLIKKLLN
jgi:peptidoglycan/xylan/chitin deacetylase (PgdA/CDA1 family)